MKDYQKAFGERLRAIRKSRGLTLEKLAAMACLSVQYLGDVERGKANPTLSTIEKISEALAMKLVDLMDVEEYQSTTEEMRKDLQEYVESTTEYELQLLHTFIRSISRKH